VPALVRVVHDLLDVFHESAWFPVPAVVAREVRRVRVLHRVKASGYNRGPESLEGGELVLGEVASIVNHNIKWAMLLDELSEEN